jgi:hypothetical protein
MTHQDPFDFEFTIEDRLKMTDLRIEQMNKLAEIFEEVDSTHCPKVSFFNDQWNYDTSPWKSVYHHIAELVMMHPNMECINIP